MEGDPDDPEVAESIRLLEDEVIITARSVDRVLSGARAEIVFAGDGSILFASSSGAAWLERPGLEASLRSAVQAFDRGEQPSPLPETTTRIQRLDAQAGGEVAYLVQLDEAVPSKIEPDPFSALTPAERTVVEGIVDGATVPEVAKALRKSPDTVKAQLRSAYKKLGVSRRVDLARLVHGS